MVVSGGDAPGINAVLARFAASAFRDGDEVVGAVGGLPGVLAADFVSLEPARISPFAEQTGTFLASSREPVLKDSGAREHLLDVLARHDIDNVVLFGGNGTLHHVLPRLIDWGVECVGLPVTIDNDVPGTERTLGFDSACNYAYQAVDGCRATARALPGRIFMIETLGGDTGFLALAVADGADASAVLVPEYDYDPDWLARRLLAGVERDGHALLVISEGVKAARTLVDELPQRTGIRMRDIRLGHGQRGGALTHIDRVLAGEMSRLAYAALKDDARAGVVVVRDGKVGFHTGTLAESIVPQPDYDLYCLINGLEHGDNGRTGD